mgnify:CR=1 FL=1
MHHSRRSPQHMRQWLQQVLPEKGYKRLLDFLPRMILGAVFSSSCHLNRIACAIPQAGMAKSMVQRVRRWIMRSSFRVDEVLPLMAGRFAAVHLSGQIVLSVDRTEWKHANFLYAAISYRGRAIPVALMLLAGPKATNADELRQLLAQAALAIPAGADVVVAGDREYGNVPAIKVIRGFGWHYCLRFRQNTWLHDAEGDSWRAKDRYPARGGKALWSQLRVTGHEYGPAQVAVIWSGNENEPWVLVSDLRAEQLRRVYGRRMCIEEMFSDLKKRGFDLESTRLRDPQRLLNLAALLSLTYLWLLLAATAIIKRGWRREVDRAGKRALSYLQIALRFVRHKPPERLEYLTSAITRRCEK